MVGNLRRFASQIGSSAAIIFGSVLLTLLVLELGLRLLDGVPVFSTANFVDLEVNAVVNRNNPVGQFDARLGWSQIANRNVKVRGEQVLTFGDYGVRMPSTTVVPVQEHGILMVGDSFGEGSEVLDAESWPAQLEKMLGEQVINAAIGGYGIDQMVLRAEDLLPRLKPKMLLVETNLAFGLSLNRSGIYGGAPKPYFVPRDGKLILHNDPVPHGASGVVDLGWGRSIFGHSYLVQFIMTRLNWLQWWVLPGRADERVLTDREGVEVTCLLLQRLAGLRDQYGIPVALVFQYGGPDAIATTLGWQADRASVLQCVEQNRLPVVDIHHLLNAVYQQQGLAAYQQLWVMQDAGRVYGHMSAKGNNLVATAVFRQLFSTDTSEAKPQSIRSDAAAHDDGQNK